MDETSDDCLSEPAGTSRMLSTFPRGAKYFRKWRTFRWFLLMLVPVLSSALGAFIRRRGMGVGLSVIVMGLVVAAMLYVDLCSGVSSSNWGTYSRHHEPVRYWFGVGVWTAFYVLISIAGYFVS